MKMKHRWPGLIMQVLGNHFRVVRFLLFSFVNAVVFCPPMFGRTSDIRLSILVGHTGTWARGNWAHGHRGTDKPLTKRPPHFKYFWPKKCDLGRSNGEGGSWWEYEGFFLPRHSVSGCQSSQPAPSWDQLTSPMKWLYHYQPPKSKYLRVWLIK